MRIASTGLNAERTRIDTIAENIANARTTRTEEGGPYRRKVVIFEPLLMNAVDAHGRKREEVGGVIAARVVPDPTAKPQYIREPGHPDADENGMVAYPSVNTVLEMSDLITAMRAYEANLKAQESFMRMAERALRILN
ncbi:MAG TPA: flagellar basal body rod protein FlgC [Planctomycetes bacterium]|nr:flagellar basal body rod protein FlgC [Planctomycetota bacterium]